MKETLLVASIFLLSLGGRAETVPREELGFAEVTEFRGVIDDPDGYVNLRKEPQLNAAVVAKVKANEPFTFAHKENEPWCKVSLHDGMTGWMHYSRIKLFFTKDDLPEKDSEGEIDKQAGKDGVNFYEVTQAAARGDKKALKKFFQVHRDGAAAEEHVGVTSVLVHLLGDDTFARFLREQSPSFRKDVTLEWDLGVVYPFETEEYFRQHFPKSAKLLFPGGS
ncbi:MAG: SH3 domain-containing protein [Chthoniobacterales bacterium]